MIDDETKAAISLARAHLAGGASPSLHDRTREFALALDKLGQLVSEHERVMPLAVRVGRHWRDQEGINCAELDALADATIERVRNIPACPNCDDSGGVVVARNSELPWFCTMCRREFAVLVRSPPPRELAELSGHTKPDASKARQVIQLASMAIDDAVAIAISNGYGKESLRLVRYQQVGDVIDRSVLQICGVDAFEVRASFVRPELRISITSRWLTSLDSMTITSRLDVQPCPQCNLHDRVDKTDRLDLTSETAGCRWSCERCNLAFGRPEDY